MFIINEKNELNYEILSTEFIDELKLEIVELKHRKTNAKIVLMICDDKNRVFNIAFKTPVENSKGTPHILEHSVLCGSRKYNVKDPFIELAKSSMNTFLNAMTFPDKTCYPIASANLKDFHNLMDVYLDAVFYPNAVKNDKILSQEGWHYEIDNVNDDLKVNGVVLNEMKGVYSNPDDILESGILKNLYGGTNYAYDYGGNPSEIIELSFDEFREFHRKYYSPSNAIIYLYGKLDYNYELSKLHDDYLVDFDYTVVDARFLEVENVKRDNELISYYNVDNEDTKDKAYVAYSFAIDKDKTSLNKIVIQILDYILFSSESAIIRNRLLELGLGESIYTMNEYSVKDAFYSIITQNIDESKKKQLLDTIISSINELLDKGIDVVKLKSAINIIHFNYAEGEYGRMPKGLVYTLTSLETYLYDKGIANLTKYKEAFDYIEGIDLGDKNNIFYKTLKSIFIDNEHRVINVLLPQYGLLKEKDEKLKKVLEGRKASFDKAKLNECIDKCKALKLYQAEKDSVEALSCIPTLRLSDLEEADSYIAYNVEKVEDTAAIITYDNDREVVYMDMRFDITDLSKTELYIFSIISMVLSKIDLKDMSYIELDNYIAMNSGGIEVKSDVYEKKLYFTISVKSLYNKCNDGLDIIYKLITRATFDDYNRINLLINESKASELLNILSAGHISAITRAESNLTFSSSILDKISHTGIARHKFIECLAEAYMKNNSLFNEAITLLFKKLIGRARIYSASLSDKYKREVFEALDRHENKIKTYIKDYTFDDKDKARLDSCLSEIEHIIPFDSFDKKTKKEAILIPSDVNFVAIANSFEKDRFSGKLNLLKTLFNYEYLWTNIRVLGGAYGCMSFFKRSGNYLFTSYRDPNLKKTNEVFNGIYDYLKDIKMSYDTLEKYIIGSIGQYDNPISIFDDYKKNVAAYFNEVDDSFIRSERKSLVNMKLDDFKDISSIFSDIKESDACALISEKMESEAKSIYDSVWKLAE